MTAVARTWGTSPAERLEPFPCERYLSAPDDAYFRGVEIDAPAPIVFRWLCQLRAAPYSYDWIDNRGRRSPGELTPGLEELSVGQSVMTIFELVEFERYRHLTLRLRRMRFVFGDVAVTYMVSEVCDQRCRLVVKLLVRHRGSGLRSFFARRFLPWGDLVMMRRQLLNLKRLAEAQAS